MICPKCKLELKEQDKCQCGWYQDNPKSNFTRNKDPLESTNNQTNIVIQGSVTNSKIANTSGTGNIYQTEKDTEKADRDIIENIIVNDNSQEKNKQPKKKTIHKSIPEKYASQLNEAYNVLQHSTNASVTLIRRHLQDLILEQEGIEEYRLVDSINKLIGLKKLPDNLAKGLHAIRHIGNFGAHPIKDIKTGKIIKVAIHEAESILRILEDLLEFYFVEPEYSNEFYEDINEKLKSAGRKPYF